MSKELEFWNFFAERLRRAGSVMLLVVAESSGSSPGRAGYKMAVAEDGELCGSIGGGVMEVTLVERAKAAMSQPGTVVTGFQVEQVHRKNAPSASGMICSGQQTVIFTLLTRQDLGTVNRAIDSLRERRGDKLTISNEQIAVEPRKGGESHTMFETRGDNEFVYTETLGDLNRLFIIGGGHCALALSELMSRMDFHISILDDRPDLNTIAKNEFADEITIIEGYDEIGAHIPVGSKVYVVVMTLGYASDAVVIRQLVDHDVRYLGVLGSKAKMAALMKELKSEAFQPEKLARIHTPIGIPINSRTPEEIAVSIAAEIIQTKNK